MKNLFRLRTLAAALGVALLLCAISCSNSSDSMPVIIPTDGGTVVTTGGGGTSNPTGPTTTPAQNGQITYTIKFEKDSALGTVTGTLPESMTCVGGTEYTLPENNLRCRKDFAYSSYIYKAKGWIKKTGYTTYESGAKVKDLATKDGDVVTLCPNFGTTDLCLVFYKTTSADYGYITLYADSGDVLAEDMIPAPNEKTGYKFDGWYLKGDATQALVDFKNYKVTEKAYFMPKYSAGVYTATFVSERGTVPSPVTWTYESYSSNSIDLTKAPYVLNAVGYKFAGWYKAGAYSATTKISYSDSSDATLTAKWTSWSATLSYNKNAPAGKTVNGYMSSTTLSYNTPAQLTSNAYYASGLKFSGWNTKADGSGTSYAEGTSYTWAGSGDNESVELFAQWEKLQTSITVAISAPASDSDISLNYNPASNCFWARLTGASVFKWYVDGSLVQNETGATLSASLLTLGQHSVMATTEYAGRSYGNTIVVNVTAGE